MIPPVWSSLATVKQLLNQYQTSSLTIAGHYSTSLTINTKLFASSTSGHAKLWISARLKPFCGPIGSTRAL